jgi:hypothetical protein
MGKQIMHSARALFLTFLAPEKSKRNSTFYEDCPTAEKLCRSSATAAELRAKNIFLNFSCFNLI